MASIRLENISKSFPGVKALQDVSLAIDSGELFTLLGPSGCGKTTLLRTIAGFYVQDAGHVFVGDECIDSVPPYRRDTGMVFQSYAIFPHMTVFENVAFGLRNRRVPGEEVRKRVGKALAMARLGGYERRTPDQLSGGQQQRVGLARAMVIEPRVLLMDEPLSNLDAKLRVEMRCEIRDIQRELGITTVYVTHDQEEALVISDRVAVMQGGVVQQVGRPWEIYKDPQNVFVASFVGNMNFVDGEIVDGAVRIGPAVIRSPGLEAARGPARIAFRPEDLTVAGDGEAPADMQLPAIAGVLRSSTFTGSLVSYVVDCGGGLQLTVERHRPAARDIIAGGARVRVGIPPGSIYAFDRQTGARL